MLGQIARRELGTAGQMYRGRRSDSRIGCPDERADRDERSAHGRWERQKDLDALRSIA